MIPATTLFRYALLGMPLAFVGLPLYLYVPKFFADTYGISLTVIGSVLLLLRIGDMVIDPLIGYTSDRMARRRRIIMSGAGIGAATSYTALFIPLPINISPLACFIVATALLYVFYSTLMINYYAYGLPLANNDASRTRLSAWREGFVLIGTLLASLVPAQLQPSMGLQGALQISAILFVIALFIGLIALPKLPPSTAPHTVSLTNIKTLFASNRYLRWLFPFFLINALPVAITSTLFLFFVADVLGRESDAGYYLALYFFMAILSTPLWSRQAQRIGKHRALIAGLVLAILSFIGASQLGTENADIFYIICALSGFALGADMIILPAILADTLDKNEEYGASAFAIWQALGKLSLALAAGICLPLLTFLGYTPNTTTGTGHDALIIAYAVVPCTIKCIALGIFYVSPLMQRRSI